MSEIFEARSCKGIPADCCDYGVVSLTRGVEVCRVWQEEDARKIADLLNTRPPQPSREEVAREGYEAANEWDKDAFGWDEAPDEMKGPWYRYADRLALASLQRGEG